MCELHSLVVLRCTRSQDAVSTPWYWSRLTEFVLGTFKSELLAGVPIVLILPITVTNGRVHAQALISAPQTWRVRANEESPGLARWTHIPHRQMWVGSVGSLQSSHCPLKIPDSWASNYQSPSTGVEADIQKAVRHKSDNAKSSRSIHRSEQLLSHFKLLKSWLMRTMIMMR